jgi:hypothetical protein
MKVSEKIEQVSTIRNAIEWRDESDKFVFCIVLLEISAHNDSSDDWVNDLENRFEALLEVNGEAA